MAPKKLIGNTRGPRPNAAMIKKVLKLRRQGMSFREIAKATGKGINRVYTWYLYGIGAKPMRDEKAT